MTTTTPLVSLEEYLHTSYEYDAEYVEGQVVYRPMPTQPHSSMQSYLAHMLFVIARAFGFEVLTEQRIKTQPDHHRVPDVCLTRGITKELVLSVPPFLCIEILSPDDRMVQLMTKVDEYLDMGVEYVWTIDPEALTGMIHTREVVERVINGIFKAGDIVVDVTGVPR